MLRYLFSFLKQIYFCGHALYLQNENFLDKRLKFYLLSVDAEKSG